jgi:glycosyltransferase involved in cell wall biosynthesis
MVSLRRLPRTFRKASEPAAPAPAQDVSEAGNRSRNRQQALVRELSLGGARRAYLSWAQYTRDRKWAAAAYHLALEVSRRQRYQAVITCGPPHMLHTAGRRLAARLGIPFVMDLRDPWSLVERVPESLGSPVWYGLAARAESRSIRDAALVVMNTPAARDAMRQKYPQRADDIIAVMNGWDAPFDSRPLSCEEPFVIAYAGSISLDRSPGHLFRAAAALAHNRRLRAGKMELRFIGPGGTADGGGDALMALASRHGVGEFVKVEPFLPRTALLERLAEAHVLVSFFQDSQMAVPSKVFEYLTLPGRVLAFATRSCATAQVLENTGAEVVEPLDAEAHLQALTRLYDAFAARRLDPGDPPPALSRASQARLLLEALQKRLSPAQSRGRDAARVAQPEAVL